VYGKALTHHYCNRSGIIPYTVIDGELYFLLARDKHSKNITDFGGTPRGNEKTLVCAKREFEEETIRCLPDTAYVPVNGMSMCGCITDSDGRGGGMTIIFLPLRISVEWLDTAPKMFQYRLDRTTRKCEQENTEIMWFTSEELRRCINGERIDARDASGEAAFRNHKVVDGRGERVMWDRIRAFLSRSFTTVVERSLREIWSVYIP
jgi:hypothetical protein